MLTNGKIYLYRGEMMSFFDLEVFPAPEKVELKNNDGDTRVPYERVKSYDDKEFELFIREWVVSLKDRYQVRGFGGPGDKGRDVIALDSDGKYYYYQCKHYDHPLTPVDIYHEFGKLLFYTFSKEIPCPCEYYILAPQDIGAKLSDLINEPNKMKTEIIKNWNKYCRLRITATPIDLTHELEEYIRAFNFSIIKTKTMLEIVSEHQKTAFYAFRFGGGLTVSRNRHIDVPNQTQTYEMTYITKILQAISEKEGVEIKSIADIETNYPKYIQSIKIQRERFYSAENLKMFARTHLIIDDYYNDLKDDVFYGIYDFLEKDFPNGYEKMNTVLSSVAGIDLSHNLLVKYELVHPQDRQGICHHLANERKEILWTSKK